MIISEHCNDSKVRKEYGSGVTRIRPAGRNSSNCASSIQRFFADPGVSAILFLQKNHSDYVRLLKDCFNDRLSNLLSGPIFRALKLLDAALLPVVPNNLVEFGVSMRGVAEVFIVLQHFK